MRSFLSGTGPVAFFDLPWMPVYLAICFLFHTFIGLTALFGAFVLIAWTIVTEIKTRHPTRSAAQFAVARNALLEASRRNAEAITAMGMVGRIAKYPNTKTFIIATEHGIIHQMQKRYPDREFVAADGCIGCRLHCPYMKMIDLNSVYRSLTEDVFPITVEEDIMDGARRSLERMMALPRDN